MRTVIRVWSFCCFPFFPSQSHTSPTLSHSRFSHFHHDPSHTFTALQQELELQTQAAADADAGRKRISASLDEVRQSYAALRAQKLEMEGQLTAAQQGVDGLRTQLEQRQGELAAAVAVRLCFV